MNRQAQAAEAARLSQPGTQSLAVAILISVMTLVQLSGCAAQPQVDAVVSRITPVESTLLEQRARIDVRLQNFSDRPISASGITLELDINGKRFARGVSDQEFLLPALGETMTSVVVGISVFDVVRQLLGLEGLETFDYVLRGKVFGAGVAAGNSHFTHRGQLTREQLASFGGQRTE